MLRRVVTILVRDWLLEFLKDIPPRLELGSLQPERSIEIIFYLLFSNTIIFLYLQKKLRYKRTCYVLRLASAHHADFPVLSPNKNLVQAKFFFAFFSSANFFCPIYNQQSVSFRSSLPSMLARWVNINVHTGLGPYGVDSMLVDARRSSVVAFAMCF